VAEMKDEPKTPKIEFLMAIAGPITSLFLSLLFGALYQAASAVYAPVPIVAVLGYLGAINLILAIFNMIPAFPTDGGRVLRAILWWIKGDILWATRTASRISVFFAMFIIFMGFISIIQGNVVGGIWWILIGSFLFSVANSSYQSLMIKQSFAGQSVKDYMKIDLIAVPSHIMLQEFVDEYLYRYNHKMFPVTKEGKISGLITLNALKLIPQEKWREMQVIEIMQKATKDNTLPMTMSIHEAMLTMNESGMGRMLVEENGNIVGIITLKDLMEFFALKIQLEP